MTNAVQILLGFGLPGCLLLAVALLWALRLIGSAWSLVCLVWRYMAPVSDFKRLPGYLASVGALSLLLWAFSGPLYDLSEEVEYRYFSPVYGGAQIDNETAVAMYEKRIREISPAEAETVIRRTGEIAAKINSTKQAIYETALLECGLNFARVRDDRVAAGWIQFTRVGLSGLGVTLEQVINACNRRDVNFIMDLTEKYLIRKWEKAGRPDMRNTIDLYLAVFAPAHIGAAPDRVVYAGFGNPAYDLNSGLDGWYLSKDRIMRKSSLRDGRIEVWEIYLCLERKKGLLLKNKL